MNVYDWKIASHPVKKTKDWLIATLAKNRGLFTKKALDEFLNPKFEQILDVKIGDIQKAIARIDKAIKKGEKIIVYSDYDADGICATAITWETLHDLGADVMPYVPHRVKEGYGLSTDAISELAKKGIKLIITVDHGVTATEQVDFANRLGIDVIVTDHHVLPEKLPKAYAIVHTTGMCGAGVAWRLCWETAEKLNPKLSEKVAERLELAAIATIADLVPLVGANRAIVKIGLEKMEKTKRPGIKALIKVSGINDKVGTFEVGFILAPRINAMGRIENGMDSLRLLCARTERQAEELASLLSKTNNRRQTLTAKAIESALSMVNEDDAVGVVVHDEWHEGIIGLVASRLVETHKKPMVVISRRETVSKGSARSITGFNIVEAIRFSSEYLIDGGGHPMAAGFSIKTEHIEAFSQKIKGFAAERITDDLMVQNISVECELEKEDINGQTLKIIEMFAPFGVANPEPVFLTRNLEVEDIRTVGSLSEHLKLQLDGFSTIAFRMGEKRALLRPGYSVDVVYTISQDRYNGDGAIQLKIKDLNIASTQLPI